MLCNCKCAGCDQNTYYLPIAHIAVECMQAITPVTTKLLTSRKVGCRRTSCPFVRQGGGAVAQQLVRSNIVIVVNDSCFVRGGLMPHHAKSLAF